MNVPVPRFARLLDLLGLVLFLAGAACYGWAWIGLEELRTVQPVSDNSQHFAAVARFNDLWELSRVGIGLMLAAGGVVAGAAFYAVVRRKREDESPS